MNAEAAGRSTLSLGNSVLVDGLKSAMGVAFYLDGMGCAVREVEVRGRRPVIRIDPPPAQCWLRGALRRRITERGVTRTVYATVCQGAQVEWETSTLHEPWQAHA